MKIEVDRVHTSEGKLVFTITVSEPHHASFSEIEKNIMKSLDSCKDDVQKISPENNSVKNVIDLIHDLKEKTFLRVLKNLKFKIENEFRPKFQPICQEIYNWIYDNQTGDLKTWMTEFDPQRTKYYFDNDVHAFKNFEAQESEHDDFDDGDDE